MKTEKNLTRAIGTVIIIAVLTITVTQLYAKSLSTKTEEKDIQLINETLANINVLELDEIRLDLSDNSVEYLVEKFIEDDNVNVLFKQLYIDKETKETVLVPIIDNRTVQELNTLMAELYTLDKFNEHLATIEYSETDISPTEDKMNCYGYTLLAMAYFETYHKDYDLEIVADHMQPHVFINLHKDGTFVKTIDLTVDEKVTLP